MTPRAEDSYSIIGEFVTEDGNVYDWYYEGNIKLINANNLKTDKDGYTIMRYGDEGLQLASFQGDLDGFKDSKGTVKYVFDVRTKREDTNFGFNMAFYRHTDSDSYIPSSNENDIVGVYEFKAERGEDFSIDSGNMAVNNVAWGSYFYTVTNVKTITHMITGGTMTVARYGEDEYDVKLDLMGKNAPDAAEESLGKYRYIGPLPFTDDNPDNYSVYTPMAVQASYMVVNTAEGIARYDIILTNNKESYTAWETEYFQFSLYSEAPRDAEGNVIDETEAETKGAISNIETGSYTFAYNTDYTANPSGAEKFTCEMIHFDGYYLKGTGFQTFIDGTKITLVPYAGEIDIVRNDDGSYDITIENMPMYDYDTQVPSGILNVSSTGIVID